MSNLKNIKILGENIAYFTKDNKSKYTAFFIHGFNSSYKFAEELYAMEQHYNIVAINLPGSEFSKTEKKLSIDLFVNVLNIFIKKHLKSKNVFLVPHSLAGASSTQISKFSKIKGFFFTSTLNPYVYDSTTFNLLKLVVKPKTLGDKSKRKLILAGAGVYSKVKGVDWITQFIDSNSPYADIVQNYLMDDDFMRKDLLKYYRSVKVPMKFILGDSDPVVDTKTTLNFIKEELKIKPIIFEKCGHNPIKHDPKKYNDILQKNIPNKKRLLTKSKLVK